MITKHRRRAYFRFLFFRRLSSTILSSSSSSCEIFNIYIYYFCIIKVKYFPLYSFLCKKSMYQNNSKRYDKRLDIEIEIKKRMIKINILYCSVLSWLFSHPSNHAFLSTPVQVECLHKVSTRSHRVYLCNFGQPSWFSNVSAGWGSRDLQPSSIFI